MNLLIGPQSPAADNSSDSGPSLASGGKQTNLVGVFERSDLIEPLARLVGQLNYAAVDGSTLGADVSLPSGGRLMSMIIGDTVASALELCAGFPDVPKILIASNASFSFRLAAARAGVNAVLARPLNVNQLADWLECFEKQRTEPVISVLIVDDDLLSCEFHAEVLRSAGMQVHTIGSPIESLSGIEATRPDIILMDMQMPDVNGLELARVIRQSRQYLSIPIVFLSAERDADRQIEARKLGGDDFISKPIDPQRLVSLVRLRADRARTLRSMIERDSLTGLLNHGRFKDRLALELERCRRTGSQITLAMVDIDHFKQINDAHGHPVGDRVIRGLSGSLVGGLRAIDVVGRYGGEEFGVILLDSGPQAAYGVVDHLRRRFSCLPFESSGQRFTATFSAGIAGSRSYGSTRRLIAAADEALYAAKCSGRNRVELARM